MCNTCLVNKCLQYNNTIQNKGEFFSDEKKGNVLLKTKACLTRNGNSVNWHIPISGSIFCSFGGLHTSDEQLFPFFWSKNKSWKGITKQKRETFKLQINALWKDVCVTLIIN